MQATVPTVSVGADLVFADPRMGAQNLCVGWSETGYSRTEETGLGLPRSV